MLDIKFVRENSEIVKENIKKKFQDEKLPLVDEVINLDKEYREIKTKLDAWFASDTKQKLIMKNEKGEIIFLKGMNLEGIIQRDANGRGHSMTNQDFPFPLPIEDKSYVALTENIGKAAQFIIGAVPDKNNPKKTHYYAEQVKLKS